MSSLSVTFGMLFEQYKLLGVNPEIKQMRSCENVKINVFSTNEYICTDTSLKYLDLYN